MQSWWSRQIRALWPRHTVYLVQERLDVSSPMQGHLHFSWLVARPLLLGFGLIMIFLDESHITCIFFGSDYSCKIIHWKKVECSKNHIFTVPFRSTPPCTGRYSHLAYHIALEISESGIYLPILHRQTWGEDLSSGRPCREICS